MYIGEGARTGPSGGESERARETNDSGEDYGANEYPHSLKRFLDMLTIRGKRTSKVLLADQFLAFLLKVVGEK